MARMSPVAVTATTLTCTVCRVVVHTLSTECSLHTMIV